MLESLERQVNRQALIAGMLHAAGAEGVEHPDWQSIREEFDTQLCATPVVEVVSAKDEREQLLMTALGMR